MTNILHTFEEHREPALPTTISIPNFKEYTDSQIITFAAGVADLYLDPDNRIEILFLIKSEIFIRIQRMLVHSTPEESKAALRTNAYNIQCLIEAYTFATTGAIHTSGFGAPEHLWKNNELEEILIEYFSVDLELHDHSRTFMMLDFIRLYNRRLNREN